MGQRPSLSPVHEGTKPGYARVIRAARIARGWSQADLAAASGISTTQVFRADTGANVPSVYNALALMDALGIPVEVMRAALSDGQDAAAAVDRYLVSLAGDDEADGLTPLEIALDACDGPAAAAEAAEGTASVANEQAKRAMRGVAAAARQEAEGQRRGSSGH